MVMFVISSVLSIWQKKFKYRVVLDDTCAIGVLGKKGRGSPDHWDVPITDIEFYSAHLDMALGTCGGFCTGRRAMTSHQRLSGAGYVFSASSPPYTCTAGIVNLDLCNKELGQNAMVKCRENAKFMRKKLQTMLHDMDSNVQLIGENEEEMSPIGSPIIHLRKIRCKRNDKEDMEFFSNIVKKARAANLINSQNKRRIWRVIAEKVKIHEKPDSETKENLETSLLHNSVIKGEEKDGWIQHAKGWSPIEIDGKPVLVCVEKMGLIFDIPQYIPAERNPPPPSIRIVVTALHEESEIDRSVTILKEALEQIFDERRKAM